MAKISQEAPAQRVANHFVSHNDAEDKPNPAKDREIPALTEQIEETINMLEESISLLSDRLQPVTNAAKIEEGREERKKPAAETQYGQTLLKFIERLKETNYRVIDTRLRLEI